MTAQLSREELRALAVKRVESLKVAITQSAFTNIRRELEGELQLAEFALAGMDSEPVAWVMADDLKDTAIISTPAYPSLDDAKDMTIGEIVPLYAAPPAQLVVLPAPRQFDYYCTKYPEMPIGDGIIRAVEWNNCIAEVKRLNSAPVAVPDKWPEKLTWSHHDDMTQAEVLAWNNAIDACRDSMQAEPVPAATVPDGWIKCSERMPDETQPVITVANGGVVQRTVYQFCDGVWSDWYDQYDHVKADAFTHWMPLPAAPEQEV